MHVRHRLLRGLAGRGQVAAARRIAAAAVLAVIGSFCLSIAAVSQVATATPIEACRNQADVQIAVDAPLPRMRAALRGRKALRILDIGPSGSSSMASDSWVSAYPARLEALVRAAYPVADIAVIPRPVAGEVGDRALDLMRDFVSELQPDVVVWRVGLNSVIARVDPDTFANWISTGLDWFIANGVDVVLVEPPLSWRLKKDAIYLRALASVRSAAAARGVPLVRLSAAIAGLVDPPKPNPTPGAMPLRERTYLCLPEYVAAALIAGGRFGGPPRKQ